MTAQPVRVFVAVDPSEAARAALVAVQERLRAILRAAGVRARFPPPDRLHLTLRFLGDVDPDRLPGLGAALAPLAATDRLEIALGALGAFPSEKKPSVLWIAPTRGGALLKSLAEQVDRCFAELGLQPEAREFTPHLTLARLREPFRNAAIVLEKVSPTGPIASPITEVVLYRSDLGPAGPRYTPLHRVRLRGS